MRRLHTLARLFIPEMYSLVGRDIYSLVEKHVTKCIRNIFCNETVFQKERNYVEITRKFHSNFCSSFFYFPAGYFFLLLFGERERSSYDESNFLSKKSTVSQRTQKRLWGMCNGTNGISIFISIGVINELELPFF